MKNIMAKIIPLLFVCCMLMAIFASCGTGGSQNGTETKAETETEINPETESETGTETETEAETESETETEFETETETETEMETEIESTEVAYLRIDASGAEATDGDYILFGTWPQSEVTDSGLISTLNTTAGTPPTDGSDYAWTSYEYYISSSNTTDFMWYQDIDIDNDGDYDYRGVYFTSYRPYWTDDSSSTGNSIQDDNGYEENTVYWFVWEPIKWRILDEEGGKALLLCEMLIDSQEYYDNYNTRTEGDNTIYDNNYEYSNIRAWLLETFYEQAFTDLQKAIIQTTTVDNSAASTTDTGNHITQATSYVCNNTEDKVFLLSEYEVTRSDYGFASYSTDDTPPVRRRPPIMPNVREHTPIRVATTTETAGGGCARPTTTMTAARSESSTTATPITTTVSLTRIAAFAPLCGFPCKGNPKSRRRRRVTDEGDTADGTVAKNGTVTPYESTQKAPYGCFFRW